MLPQPSDRRRSSRRNEQAIVVLVTAGTTTQVSAVLMDESEHGFRASHPYAGFQPGDKVSFIHRFREGVARVIWNKPVRAEFETGFAYF